MVVLFSAKSSSVHTFICTVDMSSVADNSRHRAAGCNFTYFYVLLAAASWISGSVQPGKDDHYVDPEDLEGGCLEEELGRVKYAWSLFIGWCVGHVSVMFITEETSAQVEALVVFVY